MLGSWARPLFALGPPEGLSSSDGGPSSFLWRVILFCAERLSARGYGFGRCGFWIAWSPGMATDTSCASAETGYPNIENAWRHELAGSRPRIKFSRKRYRAAVIRMVCGARRFLLVRSGRQPELARTVAERRQAQAQPELAQPGEPVEWQRSLRRRFASIQDVYAPLRPERFSFMCFRQPPNIFPTS
jgi:hypothetical protein